MTDLPIPEGDLTAAESEELLLMCGHAPGPEPLSPAARAVFEAFNSQFDWIEDGVPGPQFRAIAAALRAVADQVVPQGGPFLMTASEDRVRHQLLKIADELEGPTPSDEELMALAVTVFEDPFATDKDYARAVLARWGK